MLSEREEIKLIEDELSENIQIQKKNSIFKKAKWKLVLIGMIILTILFLLIIIRNNFSTQSQVVKLGFENIGELATQSCRSTEVIVQDKDRKLFNVSVPFTQNKYIFSYDVVIKAGIDFEKIDWHIDEEAKNIMVNLPSAEVLNHQIDYASFKVYHEQSSAFSRVSLEENNETFIEMENNAVKTAIENGLLDNATENAKKIIEVFFAKEYDINEYNVVYEVISE